MKAGRAGFLKDAEDAIRLVQDNDDAVAFGLTFARILERVILGDEVSKAIDTVTAVLRKGTGNPNDAFFAHALAKMKEWSPRPPFEVTIELGQGCDFPFHAFTAPQLMYHSNATYEEAIRETIVIGGENANRGTFIGAILAAAAGGVEGVVPAEWRRETTRMAEVEHLANILAAGDTPMPREKQTTNATTSEWLSAPPPAPEPLRNSPGCIAHGNSTSGGKGPPSHPDDYAALRALYLATGGPTVWPRNACWLNPNVSVCYWDQVLCDPDTNRVIELRLSSNVMVGSLPSEIGMMSSLKVLQLTFNPLLGGAIPDSIGNLTSLERLYAWNTSFTELPEQIGNLKNLRALDLTDNMLTSLPASLASLLNVDTAYFDGNGGLKCPVAPEVATWLAKIEYHAQLCPNGHLP